MDYLNKHASFTRRQTFRITPWMLALLALTARTQLWGAPFSFLQDNMGKTLLLITAFLSFAAFRFVKQEDAQHRAKYELPDADYLKRVMKKLIAPLKWIPVLNLSIFYAFIFLAPNQGREVNIIINATCALIALVLGCIYIEAAIGLKRTKAPLKEKDELHAKNLYFWMMFFAYLGFSLFSVFHVDSKVESPWAFIPDIPTPASVLLLIAPLYASGIYLAWRRYAEGSPRGSALDKASLLLMQIGSCLTLIWALPHFYSLLLPNIPVVFLQLLIVAMFSAAGITNHFISSAKINQKTLLLSGGRIFSTMWLLLGYLGVASYILNKNIVNPYIPLGMLIASPALIYSMFRDRMNKAGTHTPMKK